MISELLELIKEKDLESVVAAIAELKIKKELVTTDNIKNIIFKLHWITQLQKPGFINTKGIY